jgi:hypothetical protein
MMVARFVAQWLQDAVDVLSRTVAALRPGAELRKDIALWVRGWLVEPSFFLHHRVGKHLIRVWVRVEAHDRFVPTVQITGPGFDDRSITIHGRFGSVEEAIAAGAEHGMRLLAPMLARSRRQ